jgi:DNA-binding beta-propeller fold protein YncE
MRPAAGLDSGLRHAGGKPGGRLKTRPYIALIVGLAGVAVSQSARTEVKLDPLPVSAAVSRDGRFLLVLHSGERPSIWVIDTASLKPAARVALPDAGHGLAFSPDGRFVYASGGARYSIHEFSWSDRGELQPAREMSLASAAPAPTDFLGDVAISPDGRLIYAADLFHDAIAVVNPQSGRVVERFKTGRRPYRILFHPDGQSYFVTSWAEGAVYHHEATSGSEIGRIRLGPQTMDLALSARKAPDDESEWRYRLFVAAANTNNVFVVGVGPNKELRTLEVLNTGMVPAQPAGMTPSALGLSRDESILYVACSDANVVAAVDVSEARSRVAGFIPTGAYPTAARALPDDRLVILHGAGGSLSAIAAPEADSLARLTRAAMALAPYRAWLAEEQPTSRSLFEHVVYIVVEGARPDLPNTARLAREFVRFDNYHPAGETPAQGRMWATAAIAPSFTRRLPRLEPAGSEPAVLPPAGYLWSNARTAGLTVRTYGDFVSADRTSADERARAFLGELKQVEASGAFPRLTMLRLGEDYDGALGEIVEAVSRSRFWPRTAIFVADPNPGGRPMLLAVSPYTRGGAADSALYNQASVLRTIELILGLRPMTVFDATAQPLTAAFGTAANTEPYLVENPRP